MYLHADSLELTFAGLHALKPLVISIFIADTPAVLMPSTTRSTTTDLAGFSERSTLWACPRIGSRCGNGSSD